MAGPDLGLYARLTRVEAACANGNEGFSGRSGLPVVIPTKAVSPALRVEAARVPVKGVQRGERNARW
jgi:hypothetical protein